MFLKNYKENNSKLALGLLSGTSVDGIDAVLLRIKGSGVNTILKILDFKTYPIDAKLRQLIFKNSSIKNSNVFEICGLNASLGKEFASAALKICKRNNIKSDEVSLIGSHGQTIHHIPNRKYFGIKSSLQIGDPSVIANLTGITTVGDFRTADCAVGGDGAPLVPFLDYILFKDKSLNRALLNIGGISNITVLPAACNTDNLIAFDTGPGNMLIDQMMKIFYNKAFDRNGAIASSGKLNNKLFTWLIKDKVFRKQPPKSTGREHYGHDFIRDIKKITKGISKQDIICTITGFTAYSIRYNYDKFIRSKTKIDELVVSGGGAENIFLMELIKLFFRGVTVRKISDFGLTSENKEAVLFAVLANECICGNPANLPVVTGSKRQVILGKICQGFL